MEKGRQDHLPRSREELARRMNALIGALHSVDRAQLRAALHGIIVEIQVDFSGRAMRAAVRLPIEYDPQKVGTTEGSGGWI